MYIYDFEGKPIQSNSSATSKKDCVIGSIFDIGRLYEVTAGHGLGFSQNLPVLPGLKVARIYGTRNRLAISTAAPSAASLSTPSAAQPTTRSASSSAKETEDRIKGMRQDKSSLQAKIEARQLESKGFLMKNS
ncbi:hypothetical protein, partial, partial [Parasitella parasitica]